MLIVQHVICAFVSDRLFFLYSIPAQTLTPVPCGFDKTFHFNMGFVGNRSCNGELSDCEQSTILKRTWDMCDEPETEGEYSTGVLID